MASIDPTENGSVDTPKPEPQQPEPTTEAEAAAAAVVETVQPEAATNTEKAAPLTTTETAAETASSSPSRGEKKWPGWPGDCVFRVIVPVLKVGSIIGRKGDLIKKMCEETRARIRVLDGPVGNPDRVVLISGKEETEAQLSPAMDAVIRVFKRVNGFPESEADGIASGVSASFCSIRLLVASTQAISLIGKQGSLIKSIQESSGASIRVLSSDDVPTIYASSDERIVELQGEAVKILKALESVVGHLRKFLVDHSVLPLFEKSYNQPAPQERQVESWVDKTLLHTAPQPGFGSDYSLSTKRDTLFLDRETQREPQFSSSGLSMYGRDPGLSTVRSPVRTRATGPIVTQIAQTMQIPLAYAEDIIGVGGANIAYIRRTSNAILTVQESRGLPDEITVEIKGTSSQVQTAQQLIQECVNNHKETAPGGYAKMDSGLRSSYSQFGNSTYPPSSSFGGQSYGGYGSSGLGGYSSYRM